MGVPNFLEYLESNNFSLVPDQSSVFLQNFKCLIFDENNDVP